MRLLHFCTVSRGGLADYAHEQAAALSAAGAEVELLVPRQGQDTRRGPCRLSAILEEPEPAKPTRSRLGRRMAAARAILANQARLVARIRRDGHRQVLLASYSEYLAPLWAGRLRRLAQSGVVFGAVVHDPVRDYVVGPRWWHRRSVAAGYSFLREAFVHEAIELDTVLPMPRLRTTVIPHGLYRFPAARRSREAMRAELELPAGARVMLAFGHIRDGKNLDLALRAMASVPDVFLVVAGREQSGGQRSAGFYQDLARQLGVAERCRWQVRHIAAEEVGDFFAAADVALLTYTRAFRSASGVLNAAVCCRKPCIASAGQGDLRSAVRDYNLGVWVEPDDVQSLAEGMRQWVASASAPRWEAYETDHSWRRNAELVLARMSERGENP